MDVLQYSGQPIHRGGGGQMPANGQNFDPTVAALVSSMRQDLVPESSTPISNGYPSYSPNSSQMDMYSPISQPDFRSHMSPTTGNGFKVQDVTYDFEQQRDEIGKQCWHQNEKTSPRVNGRGFIITATPSPRSSVDGSLYSVGYKQHQTGVHHQCPSPTKQQVERGILNNNSYVTNNDSPGYDQINHPTKMAPQNGYVSHPPQAYHPVTTYHEEIQFGTSGTVDNGRGVVVTPPQHYHRDTLQNGVSAPDGVGASIQPKPPTSLKPRGSRTRRSLRRAADMLLNRSRQSLSDCEGKAAKIMTPVPPPSASPRTTHSSTAMSGNEENYAPSIRGRLQKNRARMGELLRSPSLSKWRRGSKENLNVTTDERQHASPLQNGTSPGYVPNRKYRSAENLNTSSYTSYETPDPYLDSRTDGSYVDSSDGMSTRSVESTPVDYPSRHQERRHSAGQAHPRLRARENHRGYHTADSDTDSSYSRHDGTNGDTNNRYNSKRPIPSSFRLLSKGNRDGPMRTTPKGPSGPLKADHSIQPFTNKEKSPRSPDEGSPRDLWAEQGARPKHYSSTDSLETEQVTHIVFQDTPIRSESEEKTTSSRPTTPSALRKSSRPPSPSRSVRFDDDTDGSYDSDRRERRAQSRRSESSAGGRHSNHHDSRHHNGTTNNGDIPMYATVDKSRKSRTPSRHGEDRISWHDQWTNGVEKEDPYSRINDDGYVSQNSRSRTEPDYEEVTFRPRSEIITSRSRDSRHGSGDPRRRSSSKESRSSRPSTPSQNDSVDKQSSRSHPMATRGRSHSKESLSSYGNPCVIDADDTIEHLGSSQLDNLSFQSDYDSYKKLSGSQLSILSRTSISEKVEKTKKKLRRALSLDKLSSSNKDSYSLEKPKLKKSPSLRSLTGLLKKKDKDGDTDGVFTKRRSASVLGLATTPDDDADRHPRPQRTTTDTDVTSPTHGRKIGRLLAIKPDGTQVIELVKPPNGPFGFYIAKGTSSSGSGIFVTRLGDGHPAKILAGLLQVGDEILEINGQDIKKKKLDDVYDLMMDNDTLVLHVRPLNSRSDFGS